jgi:ABC-type antimicrobial peptide transport system permease subunit
MLKNYFKVACRNLWRSKGFSFINITGLAIGMASAIFILLWINNEISYDRFHKNKDYLYQAWNRGTYDNKLQCWNFVPKILGPTLKKEYPEIAEIARTRARGFVTIAGERKLSTMGLIADPSFLSLFSFPLVAGNPSTALSNVYSIVVTEKMAKKMFGTAEAMNKIITIDSNNFTVTGILKDLPNNTAFNFDYILPWAYMTALGFDDKDWSNNSVKTYVQLQPNVHAADVDAKIKNITKRHSNGQLQQEVFLHPIRKWHLYSRFENGEIAGGRIETIRLFGIIAAFILLIACINFMNLSTARSEKRAKEVGVRKVAGANKGLLIGQFLGESLLMAIIAGLLALVLVQMFLPAFNVLVGKDLLLPYDRFYFWISAILFVAGTGIIAGSYPAFFLSSFNPVSVLKGTFKKANAFINPRKVLVVFQFSFAITLIICTYIVVQQIRHAQTREAGYERGALMYHWITGELKKNYPLVKNELLASGTVASISRTAGPLTESFSDTWDIQWQGKAPDDKTDFDRFSADEDIVQTAGLQLIKGRDMNLATYPTDSAAVLLNESAVKAMGFKDPIGQLIKDDQVEYHVIGVIKDFVMGSPYDHTKPMIIEGSKGNPFNVIHIKLQAGKNTAQSIGAIEQVFNKYNAAYPFEYHFIEEEYAIKFEDTQRTATLTGLFAGLTIFISCLGLFGLATYMAENRTKEIGVRKVLGASVFRITVLLSKDFLGLVVISILIASPVAWYAMHGWLQAFSYRIGIAWWVFLVAGVLALLISFITVGYQAIKAAIANPARCLRTE